MKIDCLQRELHAKIDEQYVFCMCLGISDYENISRFIEYVMDMPWLFSGYIYKHSLSISSFPAYLS